MSERPMNPNPLEPADLAQVAETDALLDRLGGRRATSEDLDDPAVLLLSGLVASVDEGPDVDQDITHLVEVLQGRPLYFGAEDAAGESEVTAVDQPIDLAPTAVEAEADRVIDLTDNAPVAPAAQLADDDDAGADVIELTPAAGVVPISHWHKALKSISMPAAAAVALIALGSGVSAVVTGNPMAPVNGVSRVMSQLPGTSQNAQRSSLDKAQAEIMAADLAARHHDPVGAQNHLAAAQSALADVPADKKASYATAIATIQTALDSGTTPPSPIIVSTPPLGVVATAPPPTIVATSPVGEPTPTDSTTPPTAPPTTDSPPTTPPSAPPTSDTAPPSSPAVADTTPAEVPDTP